MDRQTTKIFDERKEWCYRAQNCDLRLYFVVAAPMVGMRPVFRVIAPFRLSWEVE
jgi:hypothetical protein